MNRFSIELCDEQLDAILLSELKGQYELVLSCDPWCKEDAKYNRKVAKALKLVLKHNMLTDEAEEYFDEVE